VGISSIASGLIPESRLRIRTVVTCATLQQGARAIPVISPNTSGHFPEKIGGGRLQSTPRIQRNRPEIHYFSLLNTIHRPRYDFCSVIFLSQLPESFILIHFMKKHHCSPGELRLMSNGFHRSTNIDCQSDCPVLPPGLVPDYGARSYYYSVICSFTFEEVAASAVSHRHCRAAVRRTKREGLHPMQAMVKQIQAISDEITMLMALTRAYRKSPVDIITATCKQQALEQIKIFTFQLILLDLDINDCSSMELLRSIADAQPEVPIILLTTDNSQAPELQEQIDNCCPHGCWHIVEKPFELTKLTEAIERGLIEGSFEDNTTSCNVGDLRRCRRYKRREELAISLSNNGAPPFFPATLNDISVSGLGLSTSAPLPTNQSISFSEKFMHQSGRVVWTSSADDGYRSGVLFT
jgi:CheY-like chemotaxis protein